MVVFQAEVFAILDCVYEIQTQVALIFWRICKHFRLPKQRLHWLVSAKRRGMGTLTGTL